MPSAQPFAAPLISAQALAARLAKGEHLVLVDCRFSLADTGAGLKAWAEGTLPDARYAHLDEDLSGPPGPGGRHPFPSALSFGGVLAGWGVGPDTSVVAFDDQGGCYAARLWWMLRASRHPRNRVAVLDGGVTAWKAAGQSLEPGKELGAGTTVRELSWRRSKLAEIDEVQASVAHQLPLLDARAPARFSGAEEPLDPKAGHIAGATNLPWRENLDEQGRMRPVAELEARFKEAIGDAAVDRVIAYCGSGVTACHNLLAMEFAGLYGARLYVGSWSQWCQDERRASEP